MFAMYRIILLPLSLSAILAAPQNSNITYVQDTPSQETEINPPISTSAIELLTTSSNKESETITNHNDEQTTEPNVPSNNYPEKIGSSKNYPEEFGSSTNATTTYDSTNKDNLNHELRNSEYIASESKQLEKVHSDSDVQTVVTNEPADILLPSENIQSFRQAKSDNIDDELTTEPEEFTTEEGPTVPEPSKAPSPRLLPKSSYFGKSSYSKFSDNLIVGRRKFKSKCRCEKISHCSKLQISVPRCPEEYFMCCS